MSEIPHENLENFARDIRNEAEPHYSQETMCPGYGNFTEHNPASAQCGLTSMLAGKRFLMLAEASKFLESDGVITLGSGKKIQIPPIFFELMRADEAFQARTIHYAGKLAICHYGNVYVEDKQISDDHCWLRVVNLADVFDNKKGQIVETTLDQFSTPEQPLPPILVQPADREDGPVRYEPKDERVTVAGPFPNELHDFTDENDFKSRFTRLERLVEEEILNDPHMNREDWNDVGRSLVAAMPSWFNPNVWRMLR